MIPFPALSVFDYVGFIGSALLIVAFTLAAVMDRFASGRGFLVLNAFGSLLLLFSDGYRESYASFGIGVFWIAISLKALANKNVLDGQSLKTFSVGFTLYVLALLCHTLFFSGLSGAELAIKVVSVLVVETMMVSYIFLIGERIGLSTYLWVTVVTKILFVPCLVLDANSASVLLHSYGVFIAFFGLVRISVLQQLQRT
jgi:hypothetical protein